MNIDNDLSFKNIKMPQKIEYSKVKEGYHRDAQNGIVLPDIRSNQILLPDNKIYVTTSNKILSEFNKNNITIEIPNHYQKIGEGKIKSNNKSNVQVKTLSNEFVHNDVGIYKNTKNGQTIYRIAKNILSEDGILNSSEVLEYSEQNKMHGIRYIKDYEHNTETEIKVFMPNTKEAKTESLTTIQKDDKGDIIKTIEYKKSIIPGIYDITETDKYGNKSIVSKTNKDENGNITLEKNLISLDGTKTEYRFESDKEGNHKKLFTQITDSDGNVLSTIDRTYDKEGNIAYSSINGHKYKAELKDDGIEITDYFNNRKTTIKESDKLANDDEKFYIHQSSKKNGKLRRISNENVIKELFNTLPADTLLTLNDNIKAVIPLEDDLDSAFVGVFDYLLCKTDNFVINHELGHSMDSIHINEGTNLLELKNINKNPISNNHQFHKAYVEEKAAFIKEFPDFEEKFINYFLSGSKEKPERGRKETVAESNAINGLKPQPPEILAMRTTLLQRYFPRSIAELTKLMTPIAISEETQT